MGYTVYKHTTPSEKVYIGITAGPVEKRWRRGYGYRGNKHFWNAIQKYGWDEITHEILAKELTEEMACELERHYISLYHSNEQEYGYNHTTGGESGYTVSEETRKKLSKPFSEERKRHLRENHADVSGDKNPNWGKKWTAEQIEVRQKHRVYTYGSENPSAKPILQIDMEGRIVKRWGSIIEASRYYCRTSIKDCLRGKYKQHKGYKWRYENG